MQATLAYQPRRHDLFATFAELSGVDVGYELSKLINHAAALLCGLLVLTGNVCCCVVAAVLVPRQPRRTVRTSTPTTTPETLCALPSVKTVQPSNEDRIAAPALTGAIPEPVTADEPVVLPVRISLPVVMLPKTLPLVCWTAPGVAMPTEELPQSNSIPLTDATHAEVRDERRSIRKPRQARRAMATAARSAVVDTPATDHVANLSVAELRKVLSGKGIKGTRTMRREELLALLAEPKVETVEVKAEAVAEVKVEEPKSEPKVRQKKERACRLKGNVLTITEKDRPTTNYTLTTIPNDMGEGFNVQKLTSQGTADGPAYSVLLTRLHDSCDCLGNLKWHHCKHVEALRALKAEGRLPVCTTTRKAI